jgi:hypothetical protein
MRMLAPVIAWGIAEAPIPLIAMLILFSFSVLQVIESIRKPMKASIFCYRQH